MRRSVLLVFCIISSAFLLLSFLLAAQSQEPADSRGTISYPLKQLVDTPAVSGYENQLADKIRTSLKTLHPSTDNLGDLTITIGSGAPHRLIVAPIDEPGFVVSEITPDGYLRVQRLPQNGLPPIFNEMYSAHPVRIETAAGKWIDGVVAGLSVHLQPGRTNPPKPADIENIYVDIGATSEADVRKAGVDLLDSIVINRRLMNLAGAKMAGASTGDRFGAAALMELLASSIPQRSKAPSPSRLSCSSAPAPAVCSAFSRKSKSTK
jgi:putative aminopeptidase FrvX